MKKIHCVSYLFTMCLLVSCGRGPVRPERNCTITELLLNELDFPTGTIMNDVTSPLAEYPQESAATSGSYRSSSYHYSVARWYYYSVAIEENKKWMDLAFDPRENRGTNYETPPELSHLNSLPASEIHVACAEDKTFGYRCRLVARYEEYQIYGFVEGSDDKLTHELFRDLVLKINDKMMACLNKTK